MARRIGRLHTIDPTVVISASEWPGNTQTTAKTVDVSSIVPAGATAVLIATFLDSVNGSNQPRLVVRGAGETFTVPTQYVPASADGLTIFNGRETFIVPLSSSRTFEAWFEQSWSVSGNTARVAGWYE